MMLASSRKSKRYVLFKIISEEKIFKEEINSSLYNICLDFLGEEAFGQANIMIVKKNIIRVDTKYKNELIFALSLIREINGKKIMLNTLKTSGSLKKLKGVD